MDLLKFAIATIMLILFNLSLRMYINAHYKRYDKALKTLLMNRINALRREYGSTVPYTEFSDLLHLYDAFCCFTESDDEINSLIQSFKYYKAE